MSRRSDRSVLLDSEHRLQILTTKNYANVAYDSFTYNMASAALTIESNSNDDLFVTALS